MTVGSIINVAIEILIYLIIARSLLSFFPHNPQQPVWRFIYEVTDPLLKPFRRFSVGGSGFGIDFSPLLAIFALIAVQYLINWLLP